MLSLNEFAENELIKVLLEDEDEIEEEVLAKITSKDESMLYVKYLSNRNKFYKDATLYSFEDDINEVELDSIVEHYEGVYDLEDIGFIRIDEYYAKESDIDSEDSDSDIDDFSSEDNNSFIAPEDVNEWQLPSDHAAVDSDWAGWTPQPGGETRYKQMVDRVEAYAKLYKDEMDFDKNNV
jgi:hypothetical protein